MMFYKNDDKVQQNVARVRKITITSKAMINKLVIIIPPSIILHVFPVNYTVPPGFFLFPQFLGSKCCRGQLYSHTLSNKSLSSSC